jgi:integrase
VKNAPLLGVYSRLLSQTGMRAGEAGALQWSGIDFDKNRLLAGQSKSATGCREIPLNDEVRLRSDIHRDWTAAKSGTEEPDWHLFPHGQPRPSDPAHTPLRSLTVGDASIERLLAT